MSKIRTYSELSQFQTFDHRYRYLRLNGSVGVTTFGFDRWLNQRFYKSREWENVRNFIIVRDNGCDLGILGFDITSGLIVHHMNPVTMGDLTRGEDWLIDPEFLITTSLQTHNAIHFGNDNNLPRGLIVRKRGDTRFW